MLFPAIRGETQGMTLALTKCVKHLAGIGESIWRGPESDLEKFGASVTQWHSASVYGNPGRFSFLPLDVSSFAKTTENLL